MSLLDSNYAAALTTAAAALAIKITLTHVLTGRERLITLNYAQAADKQNRLLPAFRAMFLGVPGSGLGGKEFIGRAERVGKNSAENEPFFLLLALTAGLSGSIDTALGITLIQTYTVARIAHAVVYLAGNFPLLACFRPVAFGIGAFATLGMAAQVLGVKSFST